MMKQVFLLPALAAMLVTSAQAVELNTDALKTMQKEGHRIVEESEGGRAYKAANGFCLDAAGGGLVVRKCKDGAKTQKWTMDGQSRLVAHDGRCVAGPNLECLQIQGNTPKDGAKVVAAGCNKAPGQVWK